VRGRAYDWVGDAYGRGIGIERLIRGEVADKGSWKWGGRTDLNVSIRG